MQSALFHISPRILQTFLVVLVAWCSWELNHAQTTSEILPTGMTVTPGAPRGAVLQDLNPGLPALPEFKAGMAVTSALSPNGRTLLALTSGFNQNLDASGNVDPATSNEYVFVYDVTNKQPHLTRTIAYAIGPHVKRGEVVSTHYSTMNMLRTIEDICTSSRWG